VQKSGIRLKANAPSAEAEATEVNERTNDSSSFRPANTVLTGLNYLKNPDEEYPEWLWGITKPVDDGPGGKAERRRMRQENRESIKDQNFMRTQYSTISHNAYPRSPPAAYAI
jgi:large subunit ribosomal protein L54